mmetsp:Transcript_20330/g.61718  ORF Transcript_20330/g.61718 Transcript_20330/m.61718 type:complete len:110 (-) Transcript_20330:2885-3214(-)
MSAAMKDLDMLQRPEVRRQVCPAFCTLPPPLPIPRARTPPHPYPHPKARDGMTSQPLLGNPLPEAPAPGRGGSGNNRGGSIAPDSDLARKLQQLKTQPDVAPRSHSNRG